MGVSHSATLQYMPSLRGYEILRRAHHGIARVLLSASRHPRFSYGPVETCGVGTSNGAFGALMQPASSKAIHQRLRPLWVTKKTIAQIAGRLCPCTRSRHPTINPARSPVVAALPVKIRKTTGGASRNGPQKKTSPAEDLMDGQLSYWSSCPDQERVLTGVSFRATESLHCRGDLALHR